MYCSFGESEKDQKVASDSSHWKSGFIPVNHGHGDRDGLRQINLESFVYPHRNSIWHSWHTSPQQLCIRSHQESRKYQQIFKKSGKSCLLVEFPKWLMGIKTKTPLVLASQHRAGQNVAVQQRHRHPALLFSGTGELHEILMYNTTWKLCGRFMFHAVPMVWNWLCCPRYNSVRVRISKNVGKGTTSHSIVGAISQILAPWGIKSDVNVLSTEKGYVKRWTQVQRNANHK